jgi:hypothetical protein
MARVCHLGADDARNQLLAILREEFLQQLCASHFWTQCPFGALFPCVGAALGSELDGDDGAHGASPLLERQATTTATDLSGADGAWDRAQQSVSTLFHACTRPGCVEATAVAAGSSSHGVLFLFSHDAQRAPAVGALITLLQRDRAAKRLPPIADAICAQHRALTTTDALAQRLLGGGGFSGCMPELTRDATLYTTRHSLSGAAWECLGKTLLLVLLLTDSDDPLFVRTMSTATVAASVISALKYTVSHEAAAMCLIRLAHADRAVAADKFLVAAYLSTAGDAQLPYALRLALARALVNLRGTPTGCAHIEDTEKTVPLLSTLLLTHPPPEVAADPILAVFVDLCDETVMAAKMANEMQFIRALLKKMRSVQHRPIDDLATMVRLLRTLFEHASDPTVFASSAEFCGMLVEAEHRTARENQPAVNAAVAALLDACAAISVF